MREYPRITPILRQLVLSAPNGLPAKAVAALLQRDYRTLLAELGERSGHKAGVELLLPIMGVTGSDLPLDVIAEACGGFFVRMPEAEDEEHAVHRQCMKAVREFGELMQTVAKALEDGTITQDERRAIAEVGYRASTGILTLLRVVEANTQGNP